MHHSSVHHFHIPVMGIAYTIDTPIKVAHLGINSVISIVEDNLIELMRQYYYPLVNQEYFPINKNIFDYRAKRITDYLNLVNQIVHDKFEKVKNSSFEKGSEILHYLELLPEDSFLKKLYIKSCNTFNSVEKVNIENQIRDEIRPGRIDVNIMTKIDRETYVNGKVLPDFSEAVTALRGYANSKLTNSSIVFSAGMNPRLYNCLTQFESFICNKNGISSKQIIVKVSDYRSALIQGKFLAKKGVWVSEFRIESGINCGGHAFVSDATLLGPILEEFKQKRSQLIDEMFLLFNNFLVSNGKPSLSSSPEISFSVQGGIGTYEESLMLLTKYQMNTTGWGTPFLLVPEVTTVDDILLEQLKKASESDIHLSNHSPLGVRFHYLKGTSGDLEKQNKIKMQKQGSPCTEKHLALNTEFTEIPICTASTKYQRLKIKQLDDMSLSPEDYANQKEKIVEKECLCVGLSNPAVKRYGLDYFRKQDISTICPGPNIVYFNKIFTLKNMVDHIYGRVNLLASTQRPHMYIKELELYIDYWKEQLAIDQLSMKLASNMKFHHSYWKNLSSGILYYTQVAESLTKNSVQFLKDISAATDRIKQLINIFSLDFK